jgi:hypothetical protein
LPAAVEEPAVAAGPTLARERSYWPWIAGGFAAAWLATVLLWLRTRGRASQGTDAAAPPKTDVKPALRKIFRDLHSACSINDPAAARNALLGYADARFAPSPPRSLGALAAVLPDAIAHEVLELEAHIYGAAAGAWRGEGLKAVLGDLENAASAPQRAPAEPLLPLYR